MATERELRMEDIHRRIKETKEQLSYIDSMTGPLILGVIGAFLLIFVVGIFLILAAIVWAYLRSAEQTRLKSLIFQYESELSRLQGV